MQLAELAYFTDDLRGIVSFYRDLLGVDPVAQSEGMAIFMVGDTKIFIHKRYTPGVGELPPEDHVAFAVADVDAACQQLVEKGLNLEVPPRDYYWGRSAYLRDVDGHSIEIIQAVADQESVEN